MDRDSFKLFVSIKNTWEGEPTIMINHSGFPVDNVIQIKLTRTSFVDLFKDKLLNSTSALLNGRYSSLRLLQRFEIFFNRQLYNNHNTIASDITTLIANTYNDIDINPVTLETACATNGSIFNYFIKSEVQFNLNDVPYEEDKYDDKDTSGTSMLVYEMIGRELDNMISRNIFSISEDKMVPDNSYDDLDTLYTIYGDEFWRNIKIGDSIFIEGSFLIPEQRSLPVILQFVCTDYDIYQTNNIIQSIQNELTVNGSYDISSYII